MSSVLVINPGGSSKKYALFLHGRLVLETIYEKSGSSFQSTTKTFTGNDIIEVISADDYGDSLQVFSKTVSKYLRDKKEKLIAIGVRVVASGSSFQTHQKIDDLYLSLLRSKEPTAPLHIPVTLQEIQQCRATFPGVPLIAVSDTALFKSLPPVAREYSISPDDANTYDLHRFGYHGLSVSSVINRIHSVLGKDSERMIVCHVGSGISVTGLKSGVPVHTSAGYSSLTSLPMITRGGDIDAAVVLELMRLNQAKCHEVNTYLHNKAGLLALAGTDDIRLVLDQRSQGNTEATFALKMITQALQKEIAAATVATGGIDALVFTGTIGLRSPDFRSLATESLRHLGVSLSEEKNNLFMSKDGVISQARGMVKVVVMRTDEMAEIAQIAGRIAERRKT